MRDKKRTLKEIEQSDYDGLTYGELVDNDLDCKKHCPLYGEFCNGGMSCRGDSPIEPPCTSFNDTDILLEKAINYRETRERHEDEYANMIAKKEERRRKNLEQSLKRRKYNARNYAELSQINDLKKSIKRRKNAINFVESYSSAVNITNEMFRENGILKLKSDISEYEKQIDELKEVIRRKEELLKGEPK